MNAYRRPGFLLPGAREVPRRLAERYRLGLVSNGFWEAQEHKIRSAGYREVFDVILMIDDVGALKPDPRFFSMALEQLGVDRSECVLVGDSLKNDVAGAKDFGLAVIWVNSSGLPAPETNHTPDAEVANLEELLELLNA
jgi:putative hydrolase of the HAD superfamily